MRDEFQINQISKEKVEPLRLRGKGDAGGTIDRTSFDRSRRRGGGGGEGRQHTYVIHLRDPLGGKKSGVSGAWVWDKVAESRVYGGLAQVFLRVYVFYVLKSSLLSLGLLYAGDRPGRRRS